jgi:hypothetical protein
LTRLDAERNAKLVQGGYSMDQAREWQGQEYQAAAACAPPYNCAATGNAAGLETYWQAKASDEQALLPGYDPVDALLLGSGVYGLSRQVVGAVGVGKLGAVTFGGGGEASSALQGARLNEYYRQVEKYGEAGVRELENGRFRFYGELTPARTPGEMFGARLVREWDPTTSGTRTWYETLDNAGNVRSIAPKPATDTLNHRIFNANGNYTGRR